MNNNNKIIMLILKIKKLIINQSKKNRNSNLINNLDNNQLTIKFLKTLKNHLVIHSK